MVNRTDVVSCKKVILQMWLIWSDIIFELFIEVDPDTGKTLSVDRKYLAASADPRA